jgi:two-component system, OmpR family, alkaline phosphatase synthesis response regulator PhoP
MIKILLVDDEPDILNFLSYNLTKEGFDVKTANNGEKAIEMATQSLPQIILLDIMMPDLDGIEVCRRLRAKAQFDKTLIIFLTARSEDAWIIHALNAGGDDYLTKPITPSVLISRVKALLRRNKSQEINNESIIEIAELKIDCSKMEVAKNNNRIELPRKEFELLLLLVSQPGKVFTRAEIYNKIWAGAIPVGERTIDVHILKIREKIGEEYIKTIKGIGYKFHF